MTGCGNTPCRSKWSLVGWYLLLVLGIYTFFSGFFPPKLASPGHSTWNDVPASLNPSHNGIKPKFDRLVLIVIDALRSSFVFDKSSNMTFVNSLINAGHAVPFTAYAHPPTVTLPRIKALTSGMIPSFIDFATNFNGEAFADDNVIEQLHRAGKKIVFYGDDTWLRLFPSQFARYEGTTSFFVADYTEVDNNVTRRIDTELDGKSDWDVLILHYLGLDHIGHFQGPQSLLMPYKQREMDTIIKKIYNSVDKGCERSTLVVLTGDHGMNEVGNHGGSSEHETSPALVFMSPTYNRISNLSHGALINHEQSEMERLNTALILRLVLQIDLVPTLSLLFGLPIPKNNLGSVILSAIPNQEPHDELRALALNAHQHFEFIKGIKGMWSEDGSPSDEISTLVANHRSAFNAYYASIRSHEDVQLRIHAKEQLSEVLKATTDCLAMQLTEFNLQYMCIGIALIIVCACGLGITAIPIVWQEMKSQPSVEAALALAFAVFHVASVAASSFVEEEHQIVYYAITTLVSVFIARYQGKSLVLLVKVAVLLLLARKWNQTGNKWLAEMDITKYMTQTTNQWAVHVLGIGAIVWFELWSRQISARVASPGPRRVIQFLGSILSLVLIAFRTQVLQSAMTGSSIVQIGYLLVLAQVVAVIYAASQSKQQTWSAALLPLVGMLLLVQRHANYALVMLVAELATTLPAVVGRIRSDVVKALYPFYLGHATWFFFGNSNSLATIDIAGAYAGLSTYQPIVIAGLIYVTMYGGHLVAFLSSVGSLGRQGPGAGHQDNKIMCLLLFYRTMAVLVFSVVLTAMRYHLFVWTVFSPKYFYELFHTANFGVILLLEIVQM